MEKYLAETAMLNYSSSSIQDLIHVRKWHGMDQYEKIESIYDFVQNEILFGYNHSDLLTAEQVLADGYGQCNTKATLLMALLRGVGVPCRVHGFEVSKHFQRGATNALISALAPSKIVHTWAEVYYNGNWLALEGVITDKCYFAAVKEKYKNERNEFYKYAIATNDFENLSIEWQGNNTYLKSAAVVTDYGVFESPDAFFKDHSQHWSKVKNYLYVHLGRKMMNQNVSNIRKQYVSKCSRWNNGDN